MEGQGVDLHPARKQLVGADQCGSVAWVQVDAAKLRRAGYSTCLDKDARDATAQWTGHLPKYAS